MADAPRRARQLREMEALFLPEYDANTMPSADKGAAYALEHIAFRVGRIDQKLEELLAALQSFTSKP